MDDGVGPNAPPPPPPPGTLDKAAKAGSSSEGEDLQMPDEDAHQLVFGQIDEGGDSQKSGEAGLTDAAGDSQMADEPLVDSDLPMADPPSGGNGGEDPDLTPRPPIVLAVSISNVRCVSGS